MVLIWSSQRFCEVQQELLSFLLIQGYQVLWNCGTRLELQFFFRACEVSETLSCVCMAGFQAQWRTPLTCINFSYIINTVVVYQIAAKLLGSINLNILPTFNGFSLCNQICHIMSQLWVYRWCCLIRWPCRAWVNQEIP